MTTKDFIKLADALRAEKPSEHWDANKMVQWELDVKAIANVLRNSNPRFNMAKWLVYVKSGFDERGARIFENKS